MKIIITEEQFNEMIPMVIRRRMPEMDSTLDEWLYKTYIGPESEIFIRSEYIVYVIEQLFNEFFYYPHQSNLISWDDEQEMDDEEIAKYKTALTKIFGNKVGKYWDKHHKGD